MTTATAKRSSAKRSPSKSSPAPSQSTSSGGGTKRKRATAESMAAKQRSISVSEFFTKNRHLLGFDNPRKALLTTVKEAVDNSLDACEEADIVPEIWVHLEAAGKDRFKIGVQDNGPGIVKKQIPLIFGKLLYGSKFHRLRMSRGQQGIGISAAGMYGQLTTGKPVKIISKTSPRKPAHYFEIQIDTKSNNPEILNGRGDGVDIPPGEAGREVVAKHGIEWVSQYPLEADSGTVMEVNPTPAASAENNGQPEDSSQHSSAHHSSAPHSSAQHSSAQHSSARDSATTSSALKKAPKPGSELRSGTRVTIELEGAYKRGKGSVDEYLEQTAIANPHVTIHYIDPDGNQTTYARSTDQLPPEAKEIKPHPYGIELGRLVHMLKDAKGQSLSQFLTNSFSRVSPGVARKICETAGLSTRANTRRIGRNEADKLYSAIQETRIQAPMTDCIAPIGEELLLKGLHHVVPGEFYVAATRPPAVYRGNPFQIEVSLAYGGATTAKKVSLELLTQLVHESDARTLKQFLVNTFDGLGTDGAEKIIREAKFGTRQSPSKLKPREITRLHEAMRNVNLSEGNSMQVLRYANRVPLQFKQRDCAITQAVMGTNWRPYGLSQSRGSLPVGPVTVMVHIASVWVPFTSESKEAIASYPEIEKELRLGLQAVGRKLGMYLRRRKSIKQEADRRAIFLRYLGEVSRAVADVNGADQSKLYEDLLRVAKRKTSEADTKLNESGQRVEEDEEDYGENVLIVSQEADEQLANQLKSGPAQGKLF